MSRRAVVGGAALLLLAVVTTGVAGWILIDRFRGGDIVDDALRRASVAPYVGPSGEVAEPVIAVVDRQPVPGPTVSLAVDPPAGSQAMQLSTEPGFADAPWLPVAASATIDLDAVGHQTIFARFALDDGSTSPVAVAGVEVDPTYSAATSSATGDHAPSWIRPFSATEIVVRIEAGRLERGAIEPYDLADPPEGDKISKKRGQLVVQREGAAYGVQVSQRRDAVRRPDRLIGRPIAAGDLESGWTIAASDDPTYLGGVVAEARQLSRPAGGGIDADFDRVWETVHDVVLTLPSPLQPGVEYTVTGPDGITASSFRFDPETNLSPAVRVNQVGFAPEDGLKIGYLSGWFDGIGASATEQAEGRQFRVVEPATGLVAFRGEARARPAPDEMGKGDLTGAAVYELDFSTLTRSGRYRLCVDDVGCSHDFELAPGVWHGLTTKVARAMYHQRSGIELGPPFTPISRPRPHHPADGVAIQASDYTLLRAQSETGNTDFGLLVELGTDEVVDEAWGGHFDAGDWDRRINHLWYARTAAELLMAFPETYDNRDYNIPESGDDVPDILDEALWTVDLFRRMQLPNGAIRGGIEASGHPPANSASWADDLAVFAYEPDPFSSYVYAGVAAQVAAALEPYDPARASELLASAVAAMAWADDQPVPEINERATEAVADQRMVAAAALLLATGDPEWHDLFLRLAAFIDSSDPFLSCHRHTRCDAAWLYLMADEGLTDEAIRAELVSRFAQSADATIAAAEGTAYGWTTENPFVPLVWGLGNSGAPHTSGLLRAYLATGDDRYRNAALRAATVTLGANPMNRVLLTGAGDEPVRHPLITDSRFGGLPVWAGTPIYGNHSLNAIDDDSWVVDDVLGPAGATPDPTSVPYLWQWYDVSTVALFNEFTVHQSHAQALQTFAILAATAEP